MQRSFQFAFTSFIILSLSSDLVVFGEIPRPRGVAISKAGLYPPGENFVCLDAKKTIKFIQVNDDFCDCADGSDEPGTAACPNGKFHCTNAGYRTKNIPSSRVNDGICDCCDASDEYGLPDSKCVNTCLELGREERILRKSREELIKRGSALKAELITKGKSLRVDREAKLAELETRRQEAEKLRIEKENLKNDAEDAEKEALQMFEDLQKSEKEDVEEDPNDDREAALTFIKFDTNKNGYVEIQELQVKIVFDKNRDGIVSVEEAKFFLDERDRVDLATFKSIAWHRIKPYLMIDAGLFKPPQSEEEQTSEDVGGDDLQAEQVDPSQLEPTQSEVEHDQEEGADGEYETEEEEEEQGEGAVEEVTTPPPEYDPETQKLIDQANAARNEFNEADRSMREIDHELKDLQDQIAKDYGVEDEYSPLEGECFTFEDREYVYKLCPFDRASQQPRNGGAETRLGSWERWSGTQNKYSHMLYANGAPCWNGPQRSATIQMECGLEHKITAVTEPNRCEYHYVFETPAACENPTDRADDVHDEL